jgi:hypothetical protein
MKPTTVWIRDWSTGLQQRLETQAAKELLDIFQEFWDWSDLETKSKSTKQRYAGALHALGGYLIDEMANGHRGNKSLQEFIMIYIDAGEGPLIYHDNEAWQKELDTVCRKFHKYMASKC